MPPLAMVEFSHEAPSSLSTSTYSESTLITVDRLLNKKTPSRKETKASVVADRKAVHFDVSVKVRKIRSHRKYSDKERRSLWYSPVEAKELRAAAVTTVKKMMNNIDVDQDEDDCSRGLEFKTPKKNKIRQARKLNVIWAVLGEQEMQWKGGKVDASCLASLYTSCNRSCIVEALNRGVKDEMEAWGP
jgi:hypothetical protein